MLTKNIRLKRAAKSRAIIGSKYRICVFKSRRNIYAQIIYKKSDKSYVLCSSSTLDRILFPDRNKNYRNIESAKIIGSDISKKSLKENIKSVSFDRSGYLYHGIVKAIAESARDSGLFF